MKKYSLFCRCPILIGHCKPYIRRELALVSDILHLSARVLYIYEKILDKVEGKIKIGMVRRVGTYMNNALYAIPYGQRLWKVISHELPWSLLSGKLDEKSKLVIRYVYLKITPRGNTAWFLVKANTKIKFRFRCAGHFLQRVLLQACSN